MMKKMTSMLLALAMCLTLSVPAFAAEEEPELTAEPAVQTEVETEAEEEVAAPAEVETEPADEPAVQEEEDIHIHDYALTPANYVVKDDYTEDGHLYIERYKNTCRCGIYYYTTVGESYRSHAFRVSEYGTALGSNGETVTVYLYQCRACYYSYTEER